MMIPEAWAGWWWLATDSVVVPVITASFCCVSWLLLLRIEVDALILLVIWHLTLIVSHGTVSFAVECLSNNNQWRISKHESQINFRGIGLQLQNTHLATSHPAVQRSDDISDLWLWVCARNLGDKLLTQKHIKLSWVGWATMLHCTR